MTSHNWGIFGKGVTQSTIVLAALLVFSSVGCHSVSPGLQDEYIRPGLNQQWHSVFDKHRQSIAEGMTKDKIPGLSIALVDREGLIWTAGFGYTDHDRSTPVTPDTIFSIQSMSKTFTATAVMFAVQDGLVDVNTPITRHLPDFTVNSRFEQDPQDKITLRHLLAHTAGFAHEAPVGNNWDTQFASFKEHVESISDTWLMFRVGQRYSYSNLGIDLAAYTLQVRSGKPFAEYVKDKMLDALGMPDTSLDMEFIRGHGSRAVGHTPHISKTPLEIPMVGAGGVYTSAKDLSRFVQFFLNEGKVNGRTVLDQNLLRTMYTRSFEDNDYALGIGVSRDDDGNCNLGHSGGGFGFLTTMRWYPEYGIGCLVLTNSVSGGNNPAGLARDILHGLINEGLIEKSYSFDIPPALEESAPYEAPDPNNFTPYKRAWKEYVGGYRLIHGGYEPRIYAKIALALGYRHPAIRVDVFEKDGYLCVGAGDMHGGRLDEHLPGLFFNEAGDCLDLRGPQPRWRNVRMKKVK